jgi:hypothetical protein
MTKRDLIREIAASGKLTVEQVATIAACTPTYVRRALASAPTTETRGRPRKTRCKHCQGTGYEPQESTT